MTGSTMRVGGAAKAAAALSVVAAVAASAGTAVAAAPPENAPPVVSLVVDGDTAKVSGADKLEAGWVTIKASSTKGAHSLWLFTPRPNVSPAAAQEAVKAMRNVRGNEDKAKGTAADVALVEKTLLALGGAAVAPGHPATFSVNLPEGEVSIGDLAGGPEKATTPIAKLMLGDPGGAVRSAGDGNRVTVSSADGKVRIDALDTMSRAAKLRVTNTTDRWHFLGMYRLAEGSDSNDVVAFYNGSGRSPFDTKNSVISAPLSGKGEEFLDYDLPAGKYAIVDSWVDSDDGKFYATKGAIRVVTLR